MSTVTLSKEHQQFNDLAAVAIYHYADCAYKKEAQAGARRLKRAGLIENINDADIAYALYEAQVISYAESILPSDYKATYDYWGARCMSNHRGFEAPKQSVFDGDAIYRIKFFDSFEAMEKYGQRTLEEID